MEEFYLLKIMCQMLLYYSFEKIVRTYTVD